MTHNAEQPLSVADAEQADTEIALEQTPPDEQQPSGELNAADLTAEQSNEPEMYGVPMEVAFPTDVEVRTKLFADAYMNDETLPKVMVADAWTAIDREAKPGFLVTFPIKQSEYNKAVEDGLAQPGLFDGATNDKIKHTQPGAEALAVIVDSDQEAKRARVEASYRQQPSTADRIFMNDLYKLRNPEALEKLTQAFECEVAPMDAEQSLEGNCTTRLLNFSNTPISREQVEAFKRALTFTVDQSSGDIMAQRLRTVVVLPQNHASLVTEVEEEVEVKDEHGEVVRDEQGEIVKETKTKLMKRNAYQEPGLLVFSEVSLWPRDKKPAATPERNEYFESLLPDGLTLEDVKATVSEGEWEITLVHEMTHAAFDRDGLPKKKALIPSAYSLADELEADAEHAAALYKGGEDAARIPPEGLDLIMRKWATMRRERERAGLPTGPFSVAGRDIDLSAGPLPRRVRNPKEPMPTEVAYKLIRDVVSQ